MRYIVDTNLLISALIKPLSLPGKALNKARTEGRLCFSEKTRGEVMKLLSRDKFDKYLPKEEREKQLKLIFEQAEFFPTGKLTILACRDVEDNKFLELALAAKADCIITGDKDLLVLHPFHDIPILSPSDFVNQ